MKVIAHRGIDNDALKDSWPALKAGFRAVCQAALGDSKLAFDKQPTLTSHSGKQVCPSEKTSQEFRSKQLPNGEPIPFLEEVWQQLQKNKGTDVSIRSEDLE